MVGGREGGGVGGAYQMVSAHDLMLKYGRVGTDQGPLLLQDTIEWVIGTKLTGDSNVPAGEVSFKAKIGQGSRLGTPDMYPPDMGVIARYKGSGCVAQNGFQQPT